jgi:hypothetical protein
MGGGLGLLKPIVEALGLPAGAAGTVSGGQAGGEAEGGLLGLARPQKCSAVIGSFA